MARIITLTTDFGLQDEYVGVMKGVILSRAPDTRIVDLSHGIEKQNILQAALLVKSAYCFFPPGTIHLVVVDPRVGTSRRLILLMADSHLFLAPDNGVLGQLLDQEKFEAAYLIQCEQYYLSPVSSTFHGRDILAPVGGQLAAGLEPADVGPAIGLNDLEKLTLPAPKTDTTGKIITGEIIGVDNFGNLQSNITLNLLEHLQKDDNRTEVKVIIGNISIRGIRKAYGDSESGALLAVIGSRNFLEIAVNQGSAAAYLGAEIGDTVKLELP